MPSTPEVQAGILDRISAWDGIGVVVRYDRPSGTWIFIAMHDDTLGRPAGGCRMKTYDCPGDGLSDALRLSEGMTYKWAAIEMGFGGGKSVLAIPRPMEGAERTGLLERFAALLNTLHDSYGVGPDMGTNPDDMQVIARVSDNVVGVAPGGGGRHTDPGPFTALGVFAGIRAALRHRYDSDDLTHRSVHVQGVGDVGYPLARMVHDAGGRVLVSDLDGERGASVAAEVGGEVIEADHAYDVECDSTPRARWAPLSTPEPSPSSPAESWRARPTTSWRETTTHNVSSIATSSTRRITSSMREGPWLSD